MKEDVFSFPLKNGEICIVDSKNAEIALAHRWYAAYLYRYGYRSAVSGVRAWIDKRPVYLHRLVVNAPFGMVVDHRDGDVLNNTEANLRICTHSQNMQNSRIPKNNTSGFKGVYAAKGGRWRSEIRLHDEKYCLGSYGTKEEAYEAYCKASARLHGDFGRIGQNTPAD